IEFRKPEYMNKDKGRGLLDPVDLEQFESRTVFYDVFFNKEGSMLWAIGPPFLNLAKYLKKMSLTINGIKTNFSFQTLFKGLILLKAKLKSPLEAVNTVNISLKGYEWSADIAFSNNKRSIPLALTTTQKDNKLNWIHDWIRFYSKTMDVDQIIIYDNNSKYQSQLIDVLPDNVLIIPWNFTYGILNSSRTKYLHIAQINHSRLRFDNIETFLNFDIDELLVIKDEQVKKYIKKFWAVVFDSYQVSHLKPDKSDYSFSDFNKRNLEPRQRGHKYSFKTKIKGSNAVHKVILNKFIPGILNRLFIKRVSVKQAYFLHYTAITTDWKYKNSGPGVRKSRLQTKIKTDVAEDNFVRDVLGEN
ncbi:MAG: hypothetical protein KAR38_17525, partial [Calditrichia bacterium]|nr:hypothetical protein [Calditrichia bacterium]